jgi:hypothetical protein
MTQTVIESGAKQSPNYRRGYCFVVLLLAMIRKTPFFQKEPCVTGQ